ncbi:Uncharacterised protein [Klebsiella pneumoniae]|nr:Uncharacterised protein [Klebsiella pneumoniae]
MLCLFRNPYAESAIFVFDRLSFEVRGKEQIFSIVAFYFADKTYCFFIVRYQYEKI